MYLAQINVAKMKGTDINDPIMKDFVDNLDRINTLAEKSEGFVWRLKDETDNDAAEENPFGDHKVVINFSVWESLKTLHDFTYKTVHAEFVKRRKEWFNHLEQPHYALWWIEEGATPTLEQAVEKLALIQEIGPSAEAFNFKNTFPSS